MLKMNGNGFLTQEVQLRTVPLPISTKKPYIFLLALLPHSKPYPGEYLVSASHISGYLSSTAVMANGRGLELR